MSNRGVIFPFSVMQNLSDEHMDRWKSFYKNPIVSSRNNRIEEGLWRRTQNEENKEQSGWASEMDKRRRMLHYQNVYDLVESADAGKYSLAITEFYLWWHVCMPQNEITIYSECIYSGLQFGGWYRIFSIEYEEIFRCGDLYARILKCNPRENIYDQQSSRKFPDDYVILEITFFSSENFKDHAFLSKPWKILDTGIRTKDRRGSPAVNLWDSLANIFPAQIELGCGSSIEAGVPPLHFLHDVYSVTRKGTGAFILCPYQDVMIRSVISYPRRFLELSGDFYRRCFISEPTKFYHTLKALHDQGYVVDPIITNNFDGLAHRVGLQELFVRRYDETHIIPSITFHPKAKSLIVVGSHADRRRIQHAARSRGLQVVYVDPEGYLNENDFIDYPLESVQDEDLLFLVTANEFSEKLSNILS